MSGTLDGPRPIDLQRDTRAVTDLIVLSFGGRLDAAGQMALEEMRRYARRRTKRPWISWPHYQHPGALCSGFVWEEGGWVVGNVSLRPARDRGGFIIGNVCVHPQWRRRGIATALMQDALREIERHGGRWVGLEVRVDNVEARGLYKRIGFREAGRTLRLVRPPAPALRPKTAGLPRFSWRRASRKDSGPLYRLAQASIPRSLHGLLELRRDDYQVGWVQALDGWLSGSIVRWWVATCGGDLRGALGVVRTRRKCPDRLAVLATTEHAHALGVDLAARGIPGLRRLRSKLVEAILPYPREPLIAALVGLGFHKSHELAQMRLDLR